MKTKQRVSVNIHRNLDESLKKMAKEEESSKSELVEAALKKSPAFPLDKRMRRDYTVDSGLVDKIREQTGPETFADFLNFVVMKFLIGEKRL